MIITVSTICAALCLGASYESYKARKMAASIIDAFVAGFCMAAAVIALVKIM